MHQVPGLSVWPSKGHLLVPGKRGEVRVPPQRVGSKCIQVIHGPLKLVTIEVFDIVGQLAPTLCGLLGVIVVPPWFLAFGMMAYLFSVNLGYQQYRNGFRSDGTNYAESY